MAHLGRGIAVIGAGYAGMAAAVALAERGIRVTVFESGPVPGGRARRVSSQGTELDNGQHILIGAYTELYRMMGTVGVRHDALLRMPLEIRYATRFYFRRLSLPKPFGLAGGALAHRAAVLARAHAAHPERFPHGAPRVATPERLDAIGAATLRLERVLGGEGSPFAVAMKQATATVEELTRDVEAAYKVALN